jgi:hypothetical protein
LEALVVWCDYEFEGAAERQESEEEAAESSRDEESGEGSGKLQRPLRGHRRLPHEESISAQPFGKREHPVAYWQLRQHMTDQMSRRLDHAPRDLVFHR